MADGAVLILPRRAASSMTESNLTQAPVEISDGVGLHGDPGGKGRVLCLDGRLCLGRGPFCPQPAVVQVIDRTSRLAHIAPVIHLFRG